MACVLILRDAMLRFAPQDEEEQAFVGTKDLIARRPERSGRIGPSVSKDLRRREIE